MVQQLCVRCPRASIAVDVTPGMSIASVKQMIYEKEGIPAAQMNLVCHGKHLEDARTLAHYSVNDQDTAVVSLRVVGGAQLGKAVKGRSRDRKKKDTGPSKEEELLQERIRRMQEYDIMQKRANIERLRLQAAMGIEEKNGAVNRLKVQNQWRKIMRLAKLEQLRKDIEILSQGHERDVDRKDAVLQMLDRDLEEAEEQYQMAHRAHLTNVDKLIDLQDSRLLALENEFENELSMLEDDFDTEQKQIRKQHAADVLELNNIIKAGQAQFNEMDAEVKQEHETQREEIRNKNLEDINVLRITLDSTIEDLEQHFENAHLDYLRNTDQRTEDFKKLTVKDHELSREIETKMRTIERLQASLLQWRTKFSQSTKEALERNTLLQQEKDGISKCFHSLKDTMNNFRDMQQQRLLGLTIAVRKSQTKLEERVKKAERILTMAEKARSLETEQEKVCPFAGGGVDDEALDATEEQKKASSDLATDEWNYLNNFYRMYNKALLDKLSIEKDKERLQKENADLQSILKQYIDGISVNDDVMNSLNPLLVLNGRVNLNRGRGGDDGEHINVIEGNHMVGTNRAGAFGV
jgi:hypothetical protein